MQMFTLSVISSREKLSTTSSHLSISLIPLSNATTTGLGSISSKTISTPSTSTLNGIAIGAASLASINSMQIDPGAERTDRPPVIPSISREIVSHTLDEDEDETILSSVAPSFSNVADFSIKLALTLYTNCLVYNKIIRIHLPLTFCVKQVDIQRKLQCLHNANIHY